MLGDYVEEFEGTRHAAERRGRELARESEPGEHCYRATATIYDEAEIPETVSAVIEPAEPACRHGGHEWVGGPAVGDGGGVQVRYRCACGVAKIWSTWITDPETGEVITKGAVKYYYVESMEGV